jgi:uncharacterized delta-60 repeat protein
VAIQADGKIVAAGVSGDHIVDEERTARFALARYNENGTLDGTFGGDGRVTTAITAGYDEAHAVLLQSDGKIVATGVAERDFSDGFGLARYRVDGTLDSTFGHGGKVRIHFGTGVIAYGAALQSDGKIVAAGVLDFDGFALARLNTNGTLDATFGSDGRVTTQVGEGEESATSVAVQADGKIVAAGYTDVPHEGGDTYGPGRFAVVRYRSDGMLDPGFSGDGKATTTFPAGGSSANAVAVRGTKIVAAGVAGHGKFALARYDADGTLDSAFGVDGRVTTKVGGETGAAGLAIAGTGRLVAAGSAGGDGGRFALARYVSS